VRNVADVSGIKCRFQRRFLCSFGLPVIKDFESLDSSHLPSENNIFI
jgi:hypothetical protein